MNDTAAFWIKKRGELKREANQQLSAEGEAQIHRLRRIAFPLENATTRDKNIRNSSLIFATTQQHTMDHHLDICGLSCSHALKNHAIRGTHSSGDPLPQSHFLLTRIGEEKIASRRAGRQCSKGAYKASFNSLNSRETDIFNVAERISRSQIEDNELLERNRFIWGYNSFTQHR